MEQLNANRQLSDDVIEIDLLELLKKYLKKLWVILIFLIIGGVIAYGVTYKFLPPEYSATAKMYIVANAEGTQATSQDFAASNFLTSDYEQLIKGYTVLNMVISELDLDMSEKELANMITISSPPDTRIIEITCVGEKPKQVSKIANETMEAAIEYLPDTMSTVSPNVAEKAPKLGMQVGPSFIKNTALGAFVGVLLSILILTIAFIKDDTVKTDEELEKLFGLTILTVIPNDPMFDDKF